MSKTAAVSYLEGFSAHLGFFWLVVFCGVGLWGFFGWFVVCLFGFFFCRDVFLPLNLVNFIYIIITFMSNMPD